MYLTARPNFQRPRASTNRRGKEKKMKRIGVFGFAIGFLCALFSINTYGQILLNELDVNPGGTDNGCEYVELIGPPGAVVENIHFVSLEGDSTKGVATAVISFGSPGPVLGSNGLLVVVSQAGCSPRTYPSGTTVIPTSFLDNGVLQNGSNSFLLISSVTPITANTDYDTNDDGTLDALPVGATIIDGVAWLDGGATDVVYGSAILTAQGLGSNQTSGAATRFVGSTRANYAGSWYSGFVVGAPGDTTYSDTTRTLNFPTGGALTPGAPNIGNAPKRSPVDFNGDGLTDYVTVRAAGGLGSQLTWFTQFNGGSPYSTRDWGISGDQLLTGDIDGDGTDDIVIFRDSNATFYVLLTATQTMRIVPFGQTGDDPRVIGDYDGDGRDDIALYRAGSPSTWFYKPSLDSTFRSVGWGEASDKPVPGDYDGDGKNDFVVRRGEAGAGRFYSRYANDTFATQNLGLPNDKIVPADYDGDGKTDLCVVRTNAGGFYEWQFISSLNGTTVTDEWGVAASDILAPGDYDGDGKADYAVWRQGSPGTFFTMTVGDRRIFSKLWGEMGDAPIAASATF